MIRFSKMAISIHNILFTRKTTAHQAIFLRALDRGGNAEPDISLSAWSWKRAGTKNLAQPFKITSYFRRWTKTRPRAS